MKLTPILNYLVKTSHFSPSTMKFIDIGANLTDTMYQGDYNGSNKHPPDINAVLSRARAAGLVKMMVTGGNLEESKKALELAKDHADLYVTVGVHPTRCTEFEKEEGGGPEAYFNNLLELIKNNEGKVVAVGEFGLDYDRTQFCEKEVQIKYFVKQLDLCEATGLPLFLHCRNSAEDLVKVLAGNKERLAGGVVHSFDGTEEERDKILELGFYIGINGCSLKTEENLKVMKGIPAERLMIETDCPWCEVRPSHAGHKFINTSRDKVPAVDKKKWKEGAVVKGRNEPHNIQQVLDIIAAVREEDPQQLATQIYDNTNKVFFKCDKEGL